MHTHTYTNSAAALADPWPVSSTRSTLRSQFPQTAHTVQLRKGPAAAASSCSPNWACEPIGSDTPSEDGASTPRDVADKDSALAEGMTERRKEAECSRWKCLGLRFSRRRPASTSWCCCCCFLLHNVPCVLPFVLIENEEVMQLRFRDCIHFPSLLVLLRRILCKRTFAELGIAYAYSAEVKPA